MVEAQSTVARNLVLHGALNLVLLHPGIEGHNRDVLEEMRENMERMFEDVGLPAPPWGWRAALSVGGRCRVCNCTRRIRLRRGLRVGGA